MRLKRHVIYKTIEIFTFHINNRCKQEKIISKLFHSTIEEILFTCSLTSISIIWNSLKKSATVTTKLDLFDRLNVVKRRLKPLFDIPIETLRNPVYKRPIEPTWYNSRIRHRGACARDPPEKLLLKITPWMPFRTSRFLESRLEEKKWSRPVPLPRGGREPATIWSIVKIPPGGKLVIEEAGLKS